MQCHQIEDIVLGGSFIVIVITLSTWQSVRATWNNMLVLLLISRVVLEYIKAISKPTKIDVGRQSILMVCVKVITMFSSFFLFNLLNKFLVMPQTLRKFYGTEKNIGKTSYLPRLMAWTVWQTSTVPNVKAIRNNFLPLITFSYLCSIFNIIR